MTAASDTQYIVRPPTFDDLPAVVELLNLEAVEHIGRPEHSHDSINAAWTEPNVDIATNCRTYWAADGQLAAYGEFWDGTAAHVRLGVWVCIHPSHRQHGLGSAIIDWAHQRAQTSIRQAPAEAQINLGTKIYSTNTTTAALLRQHGFQLTRHFWHMERELDQTLPALELPAGITLRPYDHETELAMLVQAYADAFRDHWGFVEQPLERHVALWDHSRSNPDYDPSLWLLALDGDEIAGFTTCWPQADDDPEMGWISLLGVRRPWRQQGLGMALLNFMFNEFQRRGKKRAGLGVDAASLTGATRLYERAGMHKSRQDDTYEKILRPGIDLSTTHVN